MFIQWVFLGLQIQETASQVALRELLWGGKGGARLHRSSATKGSSLNIKRLLWIKGKPTCQCRRCKRLFRSLGREDPLKEEMATHSNIIPWEIPWTEEPDRLQSMGLQIVRCNRANTHTKQQNTRYLKLRNLVLSYVWEKSRVSVGEGNGNLLQDSCLENPMDRGAWWAIVHGVTKRWTRLTK